MAVFAGLSIALMLCGCQSGRTFARVQPNQRASESALSRIPESDPATANAPVAARPAVSNRVRPAAASANGAPAAVAADGKKPRRSLAEWLHLGDRNEAVPLPATGMVSSPEDIQTLSGPIEEFQ